MNYLTMFLASLTVGAIKEGVIGLLISFFIFIKKRMIFIIFQE